MKKYLFIVIFLFSFTTIPQKYPYEKVYVEWIDIIATDSGWHSKQDIDYWIKHEEMTVRQTGFLYKETELYVVLLDSYMSETYLGAAIKIPKCNIVKITKL